MKSLLTFLLLPISGIICAQSYWQQEVNYTIDVELNDVNHTLSGNESFTYINNSPDVLDKIYIHLWPNAYKNEKTALAYQLYSNGNGVLKFADEENRGFIDSLNFTSNGQQLKWEFEKYNIDIAVVYLNAPLQPGSSIEISTPFFVKIPSGSISRLGHIGQSYQITQWYPKPAVYDDQGWHHMPYLNQGEFFSEYGSFDVSITLPSNYVVGATGDLMTESEIEFMNERAQATEQAIKENQFYVKDKNLEHPNDFPQSSDTKKTIRYTQSNVHDFAWFADKRFQVLKGSLTLPHSNRKVNTWALYTPRNAKLWSKSLEYIHDGAYYYSLWNGDYPYNNVTAVDGTISAGGGMEYPNVTVIGNVSNAMELEVVIVHEVGHNWFYGQLGTNERVHGWMDEGLNTLNEIRYVQTKYPNNDALSDMIRMIAFKDFHFNDLDHHDQGDIAYRLLAYLGEDQPIEMHSAKFTQANYGVVMYMKTGLVFYYLKDYLGEDAFDQAMQKYYSEWEFKHPRPEHMKASLEKSTGKNLDWLFDDLIKTTKHVEFGISKINGNEVTVKNKGQIVSPVEVATYRDGKLVETLWSEPFERKTTLSFKEEFDEVKIDPGNDIPEINRKDNQWHKGFLGKVEPLKMEFLIGDNERDYTNLFWAPFIGANLYDGLMLGATIHNMGAVPNKFSFLVTPLYSFGRNNVSGFGEFSYNSLPAKLIKQSRLGMSVKTFKHDSTFLKNDSYFIGFTPYWRAKLGTRGVKKHYQQYIKLTGLYRYDQFGSTNTDHVGLAVAYNYELHFPDNKIDFEIRNEYINNLSQSESFDRIQIQLNYDLKYLPKMDRHINLRLFGGSYVHRDISDSTGIFNPYGMSLSGSAGYQDLFLENYYLGRGQTSGFHSNQRAENMGGFKSSSAYGTTTYWMTSANLMLDLPYVPKIFKLYADLGAFYNGTSINYASDAGVALKLGPVLNVYFPFYMSQEMNQFFGPISDTSFKNYLRKVRFTINLNLFAEPLKINQFLN